MNNLNVVACHASSLFPRMHPAYLPYCTHASHLTFLAARVPTEAPQVRPAQAEFTFSSDLPRLRGIALTVQQRAHDGIGFQLWPAAHACAAYIQNVERAKAGSWQACL